MTFSRDILAWAPTIYMNRSQFWYQVYVQRKYGFKNIEYMNWGYFENPSGTSVPKSVGYDQIHNINVKKKTSCDFLP